jgi:hypothetical protein
LGLTLRPLSGCSTDGLVTAEVAVDVPGAGFETPSRALVVSGSQRVAAKKRRTTTIALTAPVATGPNW